MNETQQKIYDAVVASGGSATWDEAIAPLDLRERGRALHEIRAMEQQGLVKRVNAFNPETKAVSFTVQKVGE